MERSSSSSNDDRPKGQIRRKVKKKKSDNRSFLEIKESPRASSRNSSKNALTTPRRKGSTLGLLGINKARTQIAPGTTSNN